MYTDILLATDGTSGTHRAVDHAIELANAHGATLHALYVIDVDNMEYFAVPGDIAETKARLQKKGQKVLQRVVDEGEASGVTVDAVVKSGVPHEEILDYAEEEGIDLIVVGKRGLLDPNRHVLGSTTDRVLKRAKIPVQAV